MADLLESADKSFEQTTRESDFLYASCFFSLSSISLSARCAILLFLFTRFVLFRLCFIFFLCIFFSFATLFAQRYIFLFPGIVMFEFMAAFEYESGQDRFLASVSLHK